MNVESQAEKDLINEIESGKFRNCYLVYCRKSDDEAESQKNSIDYQKRETGRVVDDQGLRIAALTLPNLCADGVIAERHSGFKNDSQVRFSKGGNVQYQIDRPKFFRLLRFLNDGHFKGVICLCWDRISRNKGDNTIIRKLMRQGVDFRFAYASYDKSSSGELHMDIDEMFAEHHSRVTREKVTAAIALARRRGYCTSRAPLGYLNVGKMEDKPIDPVRGPIIAKMFELCATGEWSLSALARFANDQGMTTMPMRRRRTTEELLSDEEVRLPKTTRPITKMHVGKIMRNRFYLGEVVNDEGEYVTSNSHKPLVDQVTFGRVQRVLSRRNRSKHYSQKLDYPMRGLIQCAYCHRLYTPYRKKGILYFNAKCATGCKNEMQNCNFELISSAVKGQLAKLYFSPEEKEDFEARSNTEIALLEHRRSNEIHDLERRRKRIRDELAYLRSERVQLLKSGAYTPEDYAQEVHRLQREYDTSLETEEVSEQAMRAVMEDVLKLSELLEMTVPLYENAEPYDKEKIARIVFSELSIAHDTVQYKLQEGFRVFSRKNDVDGAPSTSISELYGQREVLQESVVWLSSVSVKHRQNSTRIQKCS